MREVKNEFQEDFKEIAFYEFAAAPVYPEFEFQLVFHHNDGGGISICNIYKCNIYICKYVY